jgi:hypothetical protein
MPKLLTLAQAMRRFSKRTGRQVRALPGRRLKVRTPPFPLWDLLHFKNDVQMIEWLRNESTAGE